MINGWVLESLPDKNPYNGGSVRLILIEDGWVKLYAANKKKLDYYLSKNVITNLQYIEGLELVNEHLEEAQWKVGINHGRY